MTYRSSHLDLMGCAAGGLPFWLTGVPIAVDLQARGTAAVTPASQGEIGEFCVEYDQVGKVSRFEMLEALVDDARASIAPAVKRESDLGRGSVEDHAAVDEFLGDCEGL